jgi:hypothetical protein
LLYLNKSKTKKSFSGIAESHTRNGSQPWSPPYNPQALYSQPANNYFNYPLENFPQKWNQPQMPMSHDGIDSIRQRLGFNQRSSPNPYLPPQRSQQQHFTDL